MNTDQATIRIFIVDDHKLFVEGLILTLSQYSELQIVGTASNGEAAIENISSKNPDVVIMDFGLEESGMNGISTAEKLLADHPTLRILMVTSHNEFTLVRDALDKGILGFELKNADSIDLIKGIRMVFNGEKYLGKAIKDVLIDGLLTATNKHPLTPRELEVAVLLASGKARKEIANELSRELSTIDTHCKNIYTKAAVNNASQLNNWLREKGLF